MIRFFNSFQEKVFNKTISLIKNVYGDNLVSLSVYGSYANETARLNSDLDLFIIIEKARGRSFDLGFFYENIEKPIEDDIFRLFKEYKIDMTLSSFIVSKEQAVYFNPIYLDMCEGCEIVYDRSDYLRSILKRVGQIKRDHKFKKIPIANTFQWDMNNQVMLRHRF